MLFQRRDSVTLHQHNAQTTSYVLLWRVCCVESYLFGSKSELTVLMKSIYWENGFNSIHLVHGWCNVIVRVSSHQTLPANTRPKPNVVLMLGQRLLCWPNIKTALALRLLIAGLQSTPMPNLNTDACLSSYTLRISNYIDSPAIW